jgi:hypothetical protein
MTYVVYIFMHGACNFILIRSHLLFSSKFICSVISIYIYIYILKKNNNNEHFFKKNFSTLSKIILIFGKYYEHIKVTKSNGRFEKILIL